MHEAEDWTKDGTATGSASEATFMQKMRMLSGYQIARALRFAVDLDLATILADGPCTIEDLAVFTETDRGTLERHVRRLESVGVFRMNGSTVELTELGASLARETVAVPECEVTLEQPAPAPAPEPTDLPDQMEMMQDVAQAVESIPVDDAFVVSSVLNDWTYDDFTRILDTLAVGTPSGGRVVLIELVLPPDGVPERVGDTDPLLVSALGGRGHTLAEWTSVLAASGFRLERVRPGTPPFSFIEAVRQ